MLRPSPYPVILSQSSRLGLVGLLLHPVRIPHLRKRTRRRLLSSRLGSPRILWRGYGFKGRFQPGRRAVLEETKWSSDQLKFYRERAFFSSPNWPLVNVYSSHFQWDRDCLAIRSSRAGEGVPPDVFGGSLLAYIGASNPRGHNDLSPYRLFDSSAGSACTFRDVWRQSICYSWSVDSEAADYAPLGA